MRDKRHSERARQAACRARQVTALALESRRFALPVVDLDAAMRQQCTHVNSQARGDILVCATDVEITDRVQGQGCSWKQFVLDVKTGYHLGREMEC